MSSLSMVTLKDGSQISQQTVASITINIQDANKENPTALYDLVEKCKNENYKLTRICNSEFTLTNHALIDLDKKIHPDVKRVVLNSVEGSGRSLRIVSPLKK